MVRSRLSTGAASLAAIGLAVVAAWVLGTGRTPLRDREYGFIHEETTGITSFILADGKEQAIQFSAMSEPVARASLLALKWNTLYANNDGKHTVLVGTLDDRVMRTPSGPGMAQSEECREFTLKRWYILAPFVQYTDAAEAPDLTGAPGPYTRIQDELSSSDFEPHAPIRGLDGPALHRLLRRDPRRTVAVCQEEAAQLTQYLPTPHASRSGRAGRPSRREPSSRAAR